MKRLGAWLALIGLGALAERVPWPGQGAAAVSRGLNQQQIREVARDIPNGAPPDSC